MTLGYTKSALDSLSKLPKAVRKASYKQVGFLIRDLHHPSLRAKKYDEASGRWQARVSRNWRFYFRMVGDTYIIEDVIPHPK